jgi:hypothetical protein
VTQFSFPYGAFNDSLLNIASGAGYKFIFSTQPGFQALLSNKLKPIIGRVPVTTEDYKIEFLLKIFGGYNWVPKYTSLKNKLKHIYKI